MLFLFNSNDVINDEVEEDGDSEDVGDNNKEDDDDELVNFNDEEELLRCFFLTVLSFPCSVASCCLRFFLLASTITPNNESGDMFAYISLLGLGFAEFPIVVFLEEEVDEAFLLLFVPFLFFRDLTLLDESVPNLLSSFNNLSTKNFSFFRCFCFGTPMENMIFTQR